MKKRITALALAVVMVLGTAALAAGTEKSISVTPMDMTINGQAVTPLKSNGEAAEVFAYDGATYVPLRYLSELLGIEVVWDKDHPNTATLVNVPGFTAPAGGTFTGTGAGFGGDITATVTVADGKITDCTLTGDKETPAIGGAALPKLAEQVKAAGSAGIDGVSGATMTSNGVKDAVADAMAQAKGGSTVAQVKMKPGTYTAQAYGFALCEKLKVSVTVDETKIVSIDLNQVETADTPPMVDTVVNKLVPRILENQSVSVDAVSGVTATSNGVKTAVKDCLTQALVAGGSEESAIKNFQVAPEKKGGQETVETEVLIIGMGGSVLAIRKFLQV